jgi:hypothetical protein
MWATVRCLSQVILAPNKDGIRNELRNPSPTYCILFKVEYIVNNGM